MVVLFITVLVVALAFTVLQLVQKQLWGISKALDQRTEINLLQRGLWIDFQRAEKMVYDEQSKRLVLSNPIQSVQYTFTDKEVIREGDTLDLGRYSLRFLKDNQPATDGPIDALSIEFGQGAAAPKIFVFRKKTATDQMNKPWPLN